MWLGFMQIYMLHMESYIGTGDLKVNEAICMHNVKQSHMNHSKSGLY